jgi:hypothetical protein
MSAKYTKKAELVKWRKFCENLSSVVVFQVDEESKEQSIMKIK